MIIRVCCSSHPVAIAPGSVFVDPRCQFLRLHAGLVAPCFWLHFTSFREREERGKTNTEPGAIATGIILHDHSNLLFKLPGRYRSRFCIRRPTCQFLRLHGGLVAPCFWLHFTSFREREERGKTNTEPGAVATGIILHDHSSLLFKLPGRYRSRFCIRRQTCQFLRLHGGLVAPCFWLHFTSFREREERGKTNTE